MLNIRYLFSGTSDSRLFISWEDVIPPETLRSAMHFNLVQIDFSFPPSALFNELKHLHENLFSTLCSFFSVHLSIHF